MMRSRSFRIFAVGLANLLLLSGCNSLSSGPNASPLFSVGHAAPSNQSRGLYVAIIEQLMVIGKYRAALAHLDEAERQYGRDVEIRRLRGDAWFALGDLPKAEREYSAIAEADAGYGHYGLGRVAASRENWDEAVVRFGKAIAANPTNAKFINDYGCALFRAGRVHEAIFELRMAAELAPADAVIAQNLQTIQSHREQDATLASNAINPVHGAASAGRGLGPLP